MVNGNYSDGHYSTSLFGSVRRVACHHDLRSSRNFLRRDVKSHVTPGFITSKMF
jgi:hypothetical protein